MFGAPSTWTVQSRKSCVDSSFTWTPAGGSSVSCWYSFVKRFWHDESIPRIACKKIVKYRKLAKQLKKWSWLVDSLVGRIHSGLNEWHSRKCQTLILMQYGTFQCTPVVCDLYWESIESANQDEFQWSRSNVEKNQEDWTW